MKKYFFLILLIVITTTGCSFQSNNLTLNGDIQNNLISAVSTIPGKIITMNKKQGETVKKGDIIAVIDNTNQKYAADQLQAVVNMKKAKLEELLAGARPEQIEQAEAQANAAKAQLDLLIAGNRPEQIEQAKISVRVAQETVDTAQKTYEYTFTQYSHAAELYSEGALSQNDLDNAKLKCDTAQNQFSIAELQLENANQQLNLIKNGATLQSIDAARANYNSANAAYNLLKIGPTKQAQEAAQADLDQSVAQLNQALKTLNDCNITALADGIIISKNYELGDVVNIGSNLCDIAIADDLYVLCYIPDQYLDKIIYNQQLMVNTSAGVQKGTVSYIALKHEYTPKDKQSTSDSKHIATKIKVAINSNEGILKSPMTAQVQVPLK